MFEEPASAVEADAEGEGEPGLDADVGEAEFGVLEVVVVVLALGGLPTRIDPARIVLAEAVGHARLDRGKHGDASEGGGTGLLGRHLERQHLLVDVRAVEVDQGNALLVREGLRRAVEPTREEVGVRGKVDVADLAAEKVGIDAAVVVEEEGFGVEAEAVESGEGEVDEAGEPC